MLGHPAASVLIIVKWTTRRWSFVFELIDIKTFAEQFF